jgi:hypothetical protein
MCDASRSEHLLLAERGYCPLLPTAYRLLPIAYRRFLRALPIRYRGWYCSFQETKPLTPKQAVSSSKKLRPRIAMIGLSQDESRVFSDCCKQFEFEAVEIEPDAHDRMQREKFEGVAVGLGELGEETLESIRKSKSNQRVLIFAICDQLRDAYPHARFGINATFERPLERSNVLKLLKAARLLILNEFRRYLRIPIVLPVAVETDSAKINASSCELSGGGMSLTVPTPTTKLRGGDRVSVSFTLPDSQLSKMPAQVCWNKEGEKMIGVRFDETAPDRAQVKRWIDDFLGIK